MALKLKPKGFETKEVTAVNGTRRKTMPIFIVTIESPDDKDKEGNEVKDLTTIKRHDIRKMKKKFDHTRQRVLEILQKQRTTPYT